MRVHCDCCGVEIARETATVVEYDGQVFHFCSDACAENMEYHETMADPGRDEGAAAADPR